MAMVLSRWEFSCIMRADFDEKGGDWAEEEDDEYGLPPRQETVDENGVKTIEEWGWNAEGYAVKTVKKVKVKRRTSRVSKGVMERRGWKKFGDAEKAGSGLERGISTISIDPIMIEWIKHEEGEDDEASEEARAMELRKMKALDAFKMKMQERKEGTLNWAQQMAVNAGADKQTVLASTDSPAPGAPGKYVPPALKNRKPGETTDSYERDDSATVRVSNVSANTTEADLQMLFRPFGPIRRTFLSRDRVTGESKGFAFVAFHSVEDARQCIEKLDGYGYDHLILHVEWSKPNTQQDRSNTVRR
mmetsp:Transcript_11237/g.22591  ORF Transcript_11237/g.22591 Transcript_11237/m.22591 type:complete len:303 (-) Transcript_11237:368-1276(-)